MVDFLLTLSLLAFASIVIALGILFLLAIPSGFPINSSL